jgi:hypothetical protein
VERKRASQRLAHRRAEHPVGPARRWVRWASPAIPSPTTNRCLVVHLLDEINPTDVTRKCAQWLTSPAPVMSPARPSPRRTAAYWVTTLILAAERIVRGVLDAIRWPVSIEIMPHLRYPVYLMIILGVWYALADRGREDRLSSIPPPSEPDRRISRIRLSSWWFTLSRIDEPENGPLLERTTRAP